MSAFSVFATGVGLGIVHVLTGPDHLSALATLSANIGDFQAFWHGIRWGIGHSIGLILVGSILIVIDLSHHHQKGNDNDDEKSQTPIEISEKFQSFCESLVGIFMVALGLYSMINALKNRNSVLDGDNNMDDSSDQSETDQLYLPTSRNHSLFGGERTTGSTANINQSYDDDNNQGDIEFQLATSSDKFEANPSTKVQENSKISPSKSAATTMTTTTTAHEPYDSFNSSTPVLQSDQRNNQTVPNLIHQHLNHNHNHERYLNCFTCIIPKPMLSLGIGIIHGVAGPGGVLGVIPAVELHNWKLATIYLGTFCLTSTATMGSYAAIYGSCSSYISKRNATNTQFYMEMFSAGLSLFVGVLWLYLLAIGKLHEIFP